MKVGIITLFYKNINYGGNLQAYALCKYLEKNSVEVEQIQYQSTVHESTTIKIKEELSNGINIFLRCFFEKIGGKLVSLSKKVKGSIYKKKFIDAIKKRERAFCEFKELYISHSDEIYTCETIDKCIKEYDIFVTGSDQVWNFAWYDSAYFLDFVPSDKIKVSYAASFSMDELSDKQKGTVKDSLKDYQAISVREKSAVDLLNEVIDKEAILVLDPTLLLEKNEWDKVCGSRVLEKEYIFCYFLGNNSNVERVVKEFAKQKGLSLVNIPFACGWFNLANVNLGDISIVDASPEKFLSLIKHAEYVFTDSFHAVVFSFIFKKQFFVFNRDKNGTMSTRIKHLTDMFDLQERFCASRRQESLEYIESLQEIDYTVEFAKFEECREKSYEFIRENILKDKTNVRKDCS